MPKMPSFRDELRTLYNALITVNADESMVGWFEFDTRKEAMDYIFSKGFKNLKEVEDYIYEKGIMSTYDEKDYEKKYGIKGNPERPPKKWFDKTVKALSEREGVEDPQAVAGWLWYHGMKPEQRKKVLAMEKKNPSAKWHKEQSKVELKALKKAKSDVAQSYFAGQHDAHLWSEAMGDRMKKNPEMSFFDEYKSKPITITKARGLRKKGYKTFIRKDVSSGLWQIYVTEKENPIAIYNPVEMRPRIKVTKKKKTGKLGERSPLKGFRINEDAPYLIYDLCLEIKAKKNFHEKYKGERFKHNFSKDTHAQIFGLSDGSLLIKSKKGKRLWRGE